MKPLSARTSKGSRRVNIGLHGAMTPEMARTEAMKYLSDVRLGADPAGERDRRKASPTMKEFGKRFLADHVALHCKASTYGEYERSINLFINPKFGSHRIIDITRADVVGLHQSMKHILSGEPDPRRPLGDVHRGPYLGRVHRRALSTNSALRGSPLPATPRAVAISIRAASRRKQMRPCAGNRTGGAAAAWMRLC
ncbi:hypothetical protein ACFSS8_15425 [Paracoccus kondratievae]